MRISDWSSDVCSSDLVPESDQPWFVNGVASLRTDLSPWELLAVLHEVEAEHERVRSVPNASRTLDLDLLAYDDRVVDGAGGLMLPHPRLSERAFVLQPLAELAPDWRHPVSGLTAAEMLAELRADERRVGKECARTCKSGGG